MSELREGRRYRIISMGKLTRVLNNGVVKVEYDEGGVDYLAEKQHEWLDLGPVLQDGFYIDNNHQLWYRAGNEWHLQGINFNNAPTTPSFPLRTLTIGTEPIR